MRTACFIPIKLNSERVPGKNFRLLNGKKLYEYVCEHAKQTGIFDDIYVDTNSEEITKYAKELGLFTIVREERLAQNTANGNDLLVHHYELYPQYNYYFQLFATAPFLQPKTIQECAEKLLSGNVYDSCFTATENHSFYWLSGNPINYRPGILPRSQDMLPVMEETTGMYGITADSLNRYRCRIGRNPYIHKVSKFEAVDINTEEDLKVAEFVGKVIYGLGENPKKIVGGGIATNAK